MSADFYCPKSGAGKCVATGRASACCFLCFCAGFLLSYIVVGKEEVKCCPMTPVCQPQKVVIEIVAPKEIQVNAKSDVKVGGCVDVSGKVCVDSHISGGVDVKCECCPSKPDCCPTVIPGEKYDVHKVPNAPHGYILAPPTLKKPTQGCK